jgi:glycosyltransferase involved in cell wall biosynthesis
MRIGIMLRAYEEAGGIGVYARNVMRELLAIDQKNHYVLFFRDPKYSGTFAGRSNVSERVVKGKNKIIWDQVLIPLACRREKLDVIFHPKFTVPFFAPCKAVMVVHGADWFIPEQAQYYPWLDVQYIRTIMPLYFKKAAVVISVSQLTTDNFYQVLNLPQGKVKTVYFGPARNFKRISDKSVLADVRARYQLPENFILTLTKRQGGDRRKNLGMVFKAFEAYHQSVPNPAKLIVGGKDCYLYRDEYRIPNEGYGKDIMFPGWIAQEDLPAVYSLAGLYLYPSNLEAFPIPITEAMACGTPIITSNTNGLEEIAGDAALLVDPRDPSMISDAMRQVLSSPELQGKLSEKGLARSSTFTWDQCARKTLGILESLAGD